MNEKQPKRNPGQIADDVDDLVLKTKNMKTFRNRDKRFYVKLKESIDKYPKEIIANNEKPGEKLSVKLTKKLREKFKGELNILEYLFFSRSLYDPKLAHIINAFDMEDEEYSCVPYDEELSLLANYVRLTILHDRHKKPPKIESINNGIWAKTECWAKEFWKEIKSGWSSPDVVNDLYYSYKRVKEDLAAQSEDKQPSDSPASTGAGEDAKATHLKKRGPNVLNKEVKVYLEAVKWVPGLSSLKICTAINTQDLVKYRPTSRQAIESTPSYEEYKRKQSKKKKR